MASSKYPQIESAYLLKRSIITEYIVMFKDNVSEDQIKEYAAQVNSGGMFLCRLARPQRSP